MNSKLCIFLFLVLVYTPSIGCRCTPPSLLENYQKSDFVAEVKIKTIQPDSQNERYHDISVELIDLYKGEPIDRLKIVSVLNSSCAFYTPEGSTWLVFASKELNGVLSFGACSGSIHVDRKFDETRYPDLTSKYAASVAIKRQVLAYLKANQRIASNNYHLAVDVSEECSGKLKGFKTTSRFGVYEVTIATDLSIKDVRTLRPFDNKQLSARLMSCLKSDSRVWNRKLTSLPNEIDLLVIYYYYAAEGNHPSFVSHWDL